MPQFLSQEPHDRFIDLFVTLLYLKLRLPVIRNSRCEALFYIRITKNNLLTKIAGNLLSISIKLFFLHYRTKMLASFFCVHVAYETQPTWYNYFFWCVFLSFINYTLDLCVFENSIIRQKKFVQIRLVTNTAAALCCVVV